MIDLVDLRRKIGIAGNVHQLNANALAVAVYNTFLLSESARPRRTICGGGGQTHHGRKPLQAIRWQAFMENVGNGVKGRMTDQVSFFAAWSAMNAWYLDPARSGARGAKVFAKVLLHD